MIPMECAGVMNSLGTSIVRVLISVGIVTAIVLAVVFVSPGNEKKAQYETANVVKAN